MASHDRRPAAAPLLQGPSSSVGDGRDGGGRRPHGFERAQAALDSPPPARLPGGALRRRGSFWQPHVDIASGKRYFQLPRAALRLSKAKLVLARVCFFLTAMTLYTFSDAMDNIAVTILRESNASDAELQLYDDLEPCVRMHVPHLGV